MKNSVKIKLIPVIKPEFPQFKIKLEAIVSDNRRLPVLQKHSETTVILHPEFLKEVVHFLLGEEEIVRIILPKLSELLSADDISLFRTEGEYICVKEDIEDAVVFLKRKASFLIEDLKKNISKIYKEYLKFSEELEKARKLEKEEFLISMELGKIL